MNNQTPEIIKELTSLIESAFSSDPDAQDFIQSVINHVSELSARVEEITPLLKQSEQQIEQLQAENKTIQTKFDNLILRLIELTDDQNG